MEKKEVLMEVIGLKKHFVVENSIFKEKRKVLRAVDGIDLKIYKGEILGLVGESGCGKSTLGRTLLRMYDVTDGDIVFNEKIITQFTSAQMHGIRQNMQMIFQDPYSALNPRMTIFEAVKAPLDVYHIGTPKEREKRVIDILKYVGLGENQIHKFPHEMSGGQRQRVVIARAVVMEPEFIVCDEPVSALDVSVRSQVLNLMKELQLGKNMSYLFISHDLSVVRYLCDRIAVMYLGKIVEIAEKKQLFDHPMHPYTQALISAIPIPDVTVKSEKIILSGDVPSPLNPPKGCRFHTRCPYAVSICESRTPTLQSCDNGHMVCCHRAVELAAAKGA